MDNDALKKLCLSLIKADSEREVIDLLSASGMWEDPDAWRWLGDEEFNYSSVGNQQSRAEQAIVEKLINSVDAKLIAEARLAGCLPISGHTPQTDDTPRSIAEARERYFGQALKDPETLSRSITVAATAKGTPQQGFPRPCFTIVDDGEGQTPQRMPQTILSLHKGNKDKIKFAQGKFNMGGTGVLEFCGMDRNLQLVVSKRHPKLIDSDQNAGNDGDWSFTIIRREDPTNGKSSRFAYLAPIGSDEKPNEGGLLHFPSDSLPIFPEKNEPYVRHSAWGTLIKLYEYDARRFKTGMMYTDGLMYRARLMLPEPALPIRFHECRPFKGHSGSFDTAMLGVISTLKNDFSDDKRDNVEWHDKLEFDVDGERFTAEIFLFKNKEAADRYRKDEGLVFAYNGQAHAIMTKDFFRRKKVKQDYLWHSLLMFVDCSSIGTRAHERLFMNSRDRLRDGDLKAKLEAELEDQIGRHEELKELASERRRRELSENPQASESMAKVIEALLSRNPTLAALLGQGLRIKNPHKPEGASSGIAGFIGKRFPTKFHFRGQDPNVTFLRDANAGSHVRLTFETDAANDYFKRDDEPGEFQLFKVTDEGLVQAANYQRPRLLNGLAHMSITLPEDAKEGERLKYVIEINDPSRIEAFKNSLELNVKAERSDQTGGAGKRCSGGGDGGDEKGAKGKGSDQSQDSFLDIPEPNPVLEKDWPNHEPVFDKFTAIRIRRHPEAEENEDRYDFFLNIDNVYLQTYLKSKPKEAKALKLRFSVGMTLVGLAVLHQEQLRKKERNPSEDMPTGDVEVHERVAQTTAALAPFLLPLIESVGELEGEEESLSESAGEAA